MSHEVPSIRFYYRREGSVMVLRSADPAVVANLVAGGEAFEEFRRRNPNATFNPDPQQLPASARTPDGAPWVEHERCDRAC